MKSISKKLFSPFILAFLFSFSNFCSAQMHLNMNLLYNWKDNTLPTNWTTGYFSDCWGYVDSLGNEYAFMGSTMGTHIFNVTNAVNPAILKFQPGKEASGNVVHRDFKTYQHYMYGVCDEGNSSLQIFDLKYLPDSVHKIYDSQHICKTAHNIFIDNAKIYFCGMVDSAGTPVTFRAASLANPENPVIVNDLASPPFGYVHDVCVRNDTAFLSCGADGFFIYDYTNAASPSLIQSITSYPEQGYNHSSWVSADGKTLVFADETHGMGLKVYDISTINNPVLKSIFRSNLLNDPAKQSIPHNPFIVGTKVFVSYYHDGVQCFDISNTSSPFDAGYYDTFPSNTDYSGYGPGCWGVYPYLPSRHIIGSDITNGLFVLDGTQLLGINEALSTSSDMNIFPNPGSGIFTIEQTSAEKMKIKNVSVYNFLGETVLDMQTGKSTNLSVNLSSQADGIYFVEIKKENEIVTKKVVVSR